MSDATWRCEGCGWGNAYFASECDGCGEWKSTALLSRSGALAECERLRELLDAAQRESEDLRALLDVAQFECERLRAALGEPCAECGHIDWREGSLGEADGE